jgi:cyclic beta-1,2-glucan synthetase
LLALLVPPRVLPRLDLQAGIPPDCAAFVVIPCVLGRPHGAAALLEKLELHHLANPDPQLRFALLTEADEAPAADDAHLRTALEGVRALNARYCAGGPDKFFVFHRPRQAPPGDGRLGRGQGHVRLAESHRLLRGGRDTAYTIRSGDPGQRPPARFVITLGGDTQLPREAARRLIGTLAHPLNRPRALPGSGRVVEGYGALRPRVSAPWPAVNRSRFSRAFAPRADNPPRPPAAIANVAQDLFGEGDYTGTGIYDLDAFEAAGVATDKPLVRGGCARCAVATDIELLDDFPADYAAYARRQHRRACADWGLLPWLGRRPPRRAAGTRGNPLPGLTRWQIVDRLRRDLLPLALVVLLVLGWTVLPGSPWLWSGLAALVLAVRPFGPAARFGPSGRVWSALTGAALRAVFLLDQARLMSDAAVRALTGLADTSPRDSDPEGHGVSLWAAPALALSLAAALWLVNPEALPAAAGFLAAWLLAPLVILWVSPPFRPRGQSFTAAERGELRRVARCTWGFFETFVGDADHWLPPDNFQEEPRGQVAHRTSPTSQGLLLLSTLAAHDFGYLGLRTLLDRLEKTFDTLERLERFRGHFYNWYDTQTLSPLQPEYISTADSGNLLGCLLTLKQGLLEMGRRPVIGPSFAEGLADTLGVLTEIARGAGPLPPSGPAQEHQTLLGALEAFGQRAAQVPADVPGWCGLVQELARQAEELAARCQKLIGQGVEAPGLEMWSQRLLEQTRDRLAELQALVPADAAPKLAGVPTLADLEAALDGRAAAELLTRCRRLADRAALLADAMDFRFLYKADRHLFAIGYNARAGRLDAALYDLLASESCLTSFLAIARGDVPPRHWFKLGRLLTRVHGQLCLLSWGGTMFEYLMPPLLLRYHADTLLGRSSQAALARQMVYGRQMGVPWGISESAFSSQNVSLDYQYQSFGVPGLGLKRGLGKDLVIAPYATALAVPVRPREALLNLRRLAAEGALGQYGYYESIDYTRERLPQGRRSLLVRCFMAHHQGISLVAMANGLLDNPMPRRLHAEPMVRAADLLLQERPPETARWIATEEMEQPVPAAEPERPPVLMSRRLTTAHTPEPRTHLLSNGRYTVMLTNSGSGYSTCAGLDVSRWREDRTLDAWGQFVYVRDVQAGSVWSAGYQPVRREPDAYEVIYATDKAEIRRRDGEVETSIEVAVSPEHRAEVRRVTLTNHGRRARELELTSYAEVVLAPHADDLAHPALGKLFLETEWLPAHHALLCRRRQRAHEQKPVWAVHVLAVAGKTDGAVEFETDRALFLGRGRGPADPAAFDPGARLAGATGPALDPIFSLRVRVRVPAAGSVSVSFSTGVAETREEALQLTDQYHDPAAVQRAFELAWAHSHVELRHLKLATDSAHLYQRLAAPLIYAGADLRAPREVIGANREGVPGLWRHGISDDKPILLLRVRTPEELPLVQQLLVAHTYWRLKGLEVDLVILLEDPPSSPDELFRQVQNLVRASDAHALADRPGGVFLRKAAQFPEEERLLLLAAARVVLAGNQGPLTRQLERSEATPALPPLLNLKVRAQAAPPAAGPSRPPRPELVFDNGLGGFRRDEREYVIIPHARAAGEPPRLPPAPWVNVVANPTCGFVVSEGGSGYTWAGNSQLNRLTPWSNDPVADPPGEVLYLRDEATGEFWTPTPRPRGADAPTTVAHGQGYTAFEQQGRGLTQELTLFVPARDPVKIWRLRVGNRGPAPRRLSATFYAEWVLGTTREHSAPRLGTEVDAQTGVLFARNPFNLDFPAQVAFADVSLRPRTLTADRTEFLGRNGSVEAPAALARVELSGRAGPRLDPCAALQAPFELRPGETREVVFVLGAAADAGAARRLARAYADPARAGAALDEVRGLWDAVLGAVQVRTSDPALDVLLNRWLPYQVLGCCLWGRAAPYQPAGAYDFRGQLQGVTALLYAAPAEARAHLLRAASRQFLEGDVQHWWHPPAGRGVRTRSSDDFLWLPFVVCDYVAVTGDTAVLDEQVSFLRAPPLHAGQEEEYGWPERSEETASVYEHCTRALDHGRRTGPDGLPLMGAGDWDGGLNGVGPGGKGESVWGGWFRVAVLDRFADLAERREDHGRALRCRKEAEQLRADLEKHAWDGRWYLRARFDDGTPLGSAGNDECQIDASAQAWAVISGRAEPERARLAMEAVEQRLIRAEEGVILLFDPPFTLGRPWPGAAAAYPPGTRGNGGQLTQAAAWVVQAAALLGRGDRAVELFGLLNPVHRAATAEGAARYGGEPYVAAADVSGRPLAGRAGWTWYTGAAAALYRVALETILGFRPQGGRLYLEPCVAAGWAEYVITYRHRSARYDITVENPHRVQRGVLAVSLDGEPQPAGYVPLADDGGRHEVRVVLGSEKAEALRADLEALKRAGKWRDATAAAADLARLYLTAGDSERFAAVARQGLELADQAADAKLRRDRRAELADALHELGRYAEANDLFRAAEALHAGLDQEHPLLPDAAGFHYCDLLLTSGDPQGALARARPTLAWAEQQRRPRDAALAHLALGAAGLLLTEEGAGDSSLAATHTHRAVEGLQQPGQEDFLIRGLLNRARLRQLLASRGGSEGDLADAHALAVRAGLPRRQADCELAYARYHLLRGDPEEAAHRLAEARRLIRRACYKRRAVELARLQEIADLVRRLQGPDPATRAAAARLAGERASREALPELLRAQRDADGDVRRAAEDALRVFADRDQTQRVRILLFTRDAVRLDDLPPSPGERRAEVLSGYAAAHPELDLHCSADGQELAFGRLPALREFRSLWRDAEAALGADPGAFRQAALPLARHFAEQVCSAGGPEDARWLNRGKVALTLLRGPAAFAEDDLLPAEIPLTVLRDPEPANADLHDLLHLLKQAEGWPSRSDRRWDRVVFLLWLTEERGAAGDAFLRTFRTYAKDAVVFDRERIRGLLRARDLKRALRRLVLSAMDLTRVSPFTVTGPTTDSMFFGREGLLQEVVSRAREVSVALIGGRRLGKTSILHRLRRVDLPRAGFLPVYFTCEQIDPESPGRADLVAALAKASDLTGHYRGPTPDSFAGLLAGLPEDRPRVFLLDEADRLVLADRQRGWAVFRELRALSQQHLCQFVFAGEHWLRDALDTLARGAGGPLYNFAERKRVGFLEYAEVKELVCSPMHRLEIPLQEELAIVGRIWAATGGHPNVVQLLCRDLIGRLNRQQARQLTAGDVDVVLADPEFVRDNYLTVYWQRATTLERLVTLVLAQGDGPWPLRQICAALAEVCQRPAEADEVDAALRRLVELRSLLRNTSQGYGFTVDEFAQILARANVLADLLVVLARQYDKNGDVIQD